MAGWQRRGRGARTRVPPSAAVALTVTLPMMNLRRVNPGFPAVLAAVASLMGTDARKPK